MDLQDVESGRLAGSVLRCIERLCAQNDMEYRQSRRALRKAEEAPVQNAAVPPVPAAAPAAAQPEPQLPGTIVAQLDALNRKLAAANLELRRYETRMFAYERTVYALKQENAELEALCRQARQGEPLPPEPKPQEPVLDQPGLPVIRFTPDGKEAAEAEADAFYEEVSPPHWNPLQEPRTPLDHLSIQLLAQFDRMMGAGT